MKDTELIRRRNLPHWDVPGAAYFVTTCLEGSIPARGLRDIEQYRRSLERRRCPSGKDEEIWSLEQWKLGFARTDRWLDEEPAIRYLEDPRLAECVANAMWHFAGDRYELISFVVMPSHVHWVFQPRAEWVQSVPRETGDLTARQRIVQSINRFTARECNEILGRRGTFWQHESYDHWIRNSDELERIVGYIEMNPVKANLVSAARDWRFSSASYRTTCGLQPGQPLPRPRSDSSV